MSNLSVAIDKPERREDRRTETTLFTKELLQTRTMTSDISENTSELELSCPICHHLFANPVTLLCGHSFCLTCLEDSRIAEATQNHCPVCSVEYQKTRLEFSERNMKLISIVESYRATEDAKDKHVSQRGAEGIMTENNGEQYCSNQSESGDNTDGNMKNAAAVDAYSSDSARKLSDEQVSKDRLRLTTVMTDLQAKISQVDDILNKVKERESAVKKKNADLRAEVSNHLEEMCELLKKYSNAGMELLESELKPRQEVVENRVEKILDLHGLLKEAEVQVNTLLEEQDDGTFSERILNIEAHAASLKLDPTELEITDEENTNMANMCLEMERLNCQLRLELGAGQRRLRTIFNPSEVTFNPETMHPSLVLSEDLKTVSFTVVKQLYPAGPQRFMSFLQALSSQCFSSGEHCWNLKAEGCSWVLGVCYGGLPRSGSGSGLESNTGVWCLMWCDNLLRAYERGKETPLMRTPHLQRVEIRLSFKSNSVAFYSISSVNGAKTHLHTFKVSFTEPVYLAVRMMSGQPKAQIMVCN